MLIMSEKSENGVYLTTMSINTGRNGQTAPTYYGEPGIR